MSSRIKKQYLEFAWVLAGTAAHLSIAIFILIILGIYDSSSQINIEPGLSFLVYIQIYASLVSLLPIPGFNGFDLISKWMDEQTQLLAERTEPLIASHLIVIALLVFTGQGKKFTSLVQNITYSMAVTLGVYNNASQDTSFPNLIKQGRVLVSENALLISMIAIFLYCLGKIYAFIMRNRPRFQKQSDSRWSRDRAESMYRKGYSFLIDGNFREAARYYQKAYEAYPDDTKYWIGCALSLHELGQYEESIYFYRKLLGVNSKEAEMLYRYSMALVSLKRYKSALKIFDKLLSADIESNGCWSYTNVLDSKGHALREIGEYDLAAKAFFRANQLEPSINSICARAAILIDHLNREQEALSELREAIELANEAVAEDPHFGTLFQRGCVYTLSKQFEKAKDDFFLVIQANPYHSSAWYNLACCYARQSNETLAIDALNWAVAIQPESLIESARTDRSFNEIRSLPAFQELVPNKIE